MASINTIVKRKQYLWLGIVVDGLYRLRHPAAVHSGADTAGPGDGGHGKL